MKWEPGAKPKGPAEATAITAYARRRAGGAKAARAGKSWESAVMAVVPWLVRIEDGCKRVRTGLVRVPQPCDFFGGVPGCGRLVVCDAKSLDRASFNPASDELKPQQRRFLHKQVEAGNVAGLLLHLRKPRMVCWLGGEFLNLDEPIAWSDKRMIQLGPIEDWSFDDVLLRNGIVDWSN